LLITLLNQLSALSRQLSVTTSSSQLSALTES